MKKNAWLLPALIFAAMPLSGRAAEPSVPPIFESRTGVLAYVPPDADLAVHVRMAQLVESNLWKRFADPKVGFYQEFAKEIGEDVTIDPEKDVAAALLVFKLTYEEDGDPDEPLLGYALAFNRDIQPEAFFVRERDRQPVNVPGVPGPVYRSIRPMLVAFPDSRTVVGAMPEYLASMLAAPNTVPAPSIRRALAAPGEITFAGQMPDQLKAALRVEYDRYRGQRLRRMDGERLLEFALLYNLFRVADDAASIVGSLDLSREADALRIAVTFNSDRSAAVLAAGLDAMADPLAMALPALFGSPILEAPPESPLYRARAEGGEASITMSRTSAERLLDQVLSGAAQQAARVASASNLRQLGVAIRRYVTDHGAYPPNASALFPNYLPDRKVLENPALGAHFPDGDYELVPMTTEAAKKEPWAKVLAFERYPRDNPPATLYVLFADGHVEHIRAGQFNQFLRQTLEHLGR